METTRKVSQNLRPGWTSEGEARGRDKLSILDIVDKPIHSLERVK